MSNYIVCILTFISWIKATICICKNKGRDQLCSCCTDQSCSCCTDRLCSCCTDQLCSCCTADQHLRFCSMNSTITLLPTSQIPASMTVTGQFVLDLVGNIVIFFFYFPRMYLSPCWWKRAPRRPGSSTSGSLDS